MKIICDVLGFLSFDFNFCTCAVESTSRRNWNHSPLLGVCYDYTDDGTYDKCFSSDTDVEGYWTGFSMEDADKCNIECDYTEQPEIEQWYLNQTVGIGAISSTMRANICNIYEVCDEDTQDYSFAAPTYITNCSIVESADVLVTLRGDSVYSHWEYASALSGTTVEIKVSSSVANNVYFPNRFALWTIWGNNITSQTIAEYNVPIFGYRRVFTFDWGRFCYASDINDCSNPCENWGGGDTCSDITTNSWDTSFEYTVQGTGDVHFLVITGYDFDYADDTYWSSAMCEVVWSGPDIEGCILPSDIDDDLDDDFKVFMNSTTVNLTIGFDPNCSIIVARNENFVVDRVSPNETILNSTFVDWSDVNKSNYNLAFNTTGLTNEITGACWDTNNDGIWDAYAGYINCADPTIEDGGVYNNITTVCIGATLNWSANWWTHYNITRNDTNVTIIKVQVMDICGATVVNSTQTAYWDRGAASLLCNNGVLDDENNEIYTSNTNTISDYGGTCGLCADGILNNAEVQTNYDGTGFDYGGMWCGTCDSSGSKDEIWLAAIREFGLTVPFDQELCREIEGTITLAAIFMIIIMFIILIFLLFLAIAISIPLFIMMFKVVV
ncbi:hypothetical protein LCGC14_1592010, partial [marine sediment metagenome]